MLLGWEVLFGLSFFYSLRELIRVNILLSIAILLIATKAAGLLSQKLKMPEVLGALLAGVVLGPVALNLIEYNDSIRLLSNLGVILLLFLAGLRTDADHFKKAGKSSLLIAFFGVAMSLILGTLSAFLFFSNFIEVMFIGVLLTATSVSISVETLTELGKLGTRSGINILGAAVIDDVMGLVLVSILVAYINKGTGTSLGSAIIGVAMFCGIGVLAIIFMPKVLNKRMKNIKPGRAVLTYAIAAALFAAFLAEKAGLAAITGAYICGLMLSQFTHKEYLERNIRAISSGFLSLIFFAGVGLEVTRAGLSGRALLITGVLLAVAVAGKVLGCGAAARLEKLSRSESLQVGVGMITRGEVTIVIANIGLQNGIISQEVFVPVLLVVLLTALVTPILLKIAFSHHVERRLDRKTLQENPPESI